LGYKTMLQVCCYKGCGIVYGEKEPLGDHSKTHGLCPMHHELTLTEIRGELNKIKHENRVSKILIVEDSRLFRQLLTKALHERFPNIEIAEAENGEEALRKIEASRPDMVFMDIQLPGENGIEVSKKIKTLYPNVIIIILTGYDFPEYRTASREYADYFFSKDLVTAELIFNITRSVL
jgi:CheY-like chemotaxis protein